MEANKIISPQSLYPSLFLKTISPSIPEPKSSSMEGSGTDAGAIPV
jgi:hypothetical protein